MMSPPLHVEREQSNLTIDWCIWDFVYTLIIRTYLIWAHFTSMHMICPRRLLICDVGTYTIPPSSVNSVSSCGCILLPNPVPANWSRRRCLWEFKKSDSSVELSDSSSLIQVVVVVLSTKHANLFVTYPKGRVHQNGLCQMELIRRLPVPHFWTMMMIIILLCKTIVARLQQYVRTWRRRVS